MMGAWGPATKNGKLVQYRTLDFGGGPFANHNVLVVNHPTDSKNAFASVSWPGFAAAVTGFSEKIAQSEKVDDVTGGKRPKGTYKGQGDAFLIRDMLQFADSKEEAVAMAKKTKRTWSVWLGIGDYESQEFEAMIYDEEEATGLTDETLPKLTSQKAFHGVEYIDKHPQPSAHTDVPTLVNDYYGKLDAETVATVFPQTMNSGDVHLAVYDFDLAQTYISHGKVDTNGDYIYQAW